MTLLDLSQPGWRPPDTVVGMASGSMATEPDLGVLGTESLGSIGRTFLASWIRFWQLRPPKMPRMLGTWLETDPNQNAFPSLSLPTDSDHESAKLYRLIELADRQALPMWVTGDSNARTEGETRVHPPRMFSWIPLSRTRRGVLEVGFAADRNRVSDRDREVYLRALVQLRDSLCHSLGLKGSLSNLSLPLTLQDSLTHPKSHQSGDDSIRSLIGLSKALDESRKALLRQIDEQLEAIEGTRLDSLHANQLLAKHLHRLLDSHGFRVRCSECGEPAILRCLAAGNSPTGSFVFDHTLSQGRTFHGGRSALPRLHAIAKPARRATPIR